MLVDDLNRRGRFLWPVACLLLLVSSCAPTPRTITPEESWAGKDLGDFPYHPLVYHLDLSILTYQLYGQSLVWPFDPYYEEMGKERNDFIKKVWGWTEQTGAEQVDSHAGLDAFRGPGVLNGFANNALHDPIIYNYARVHPWSNGITNAYGSWTEYLTPNEITGQIEDVFVSYRPSGSPEASVSVERVVTAHDDSDAGARDVLCAFEGGTGDKGESGQPASQSLMGFALLRTTPSDRYDVHIAFRGSRSGSGARAMLQSFSEHKASGNPDWITDMGFDRVVPGEGAEHITTTSAVSRGFARSMSSILPSLMNCLNKFADSKEGAGPDNIYVTGHSLGAALAQHFVSAMLLGNQYGPDGNGSAMPAALTDWPWQQIKLITYGAPRAGEKEWAQLLTEVGLDSDFFSTVLNPIDTNALVTTDQSIVSRLLDRSRPAGFRVLIPQDPLASERVPGGGKHVGKTVYVAEARIRDSYLPPDVDAHEPKNIRRHMVESIADPRTPPIAWRSREISELVPDWNPDERGSAAELEKLVEGIKRYFSDNEMWFDAERLDKDLAIRLAIDRGDAERR